MTNKRTRLSVAFLILGMFAGACQSEARSEPPMPTATSTRALNTPAPLPTTSTATAEATETATISISSTLNATEEIRLLEDFSGESTCLETIANDEIQGSVEEEAYRLEVMGDNVTANVNCETVVVGNFSLEVDAQVLEAPSGGTYYFGLLFRVSGEERYAFVVGSEGGYCAYYVGPQSFVTLTNSTDFATACWVRIPEAAVKEGEQHLQVVAVEDRMDLMLNGVLLGVVRDNRLREGWVGLVAATANQGGLVVVFDNLRVAKR